MDLAILMEPTVVAVMHSAMVLQKKRALPSPKRVRRRARGPIVVSLSHINIALCDNTKGIARIRP